MTSGLPAVPPAPSTNTAAGTAPGKRVGIIYDFDLTLSEEYQQYPLLRKFSRQITEKYGGDCGIESIDDYFRILCGSHDIDVGIGAMQQVLKDAQDIFKGLTNAAMREVYAPQIRLSPGLPEWFPRINDYGAVLGLEVEHHVVSAGFAPLIEGTGLAPYLTSIRSGNFLDDGEKITHIRSIIDPNNKREEIIKICKGRGLHEELPIGGYHINYDNLIVIGDGQSDRRKFNFVTELGGDAMGVYRPGDETALESARKELEGRVRYLLPRDYREGNSLDVTLRKLLRRKASRRCTFDYRLVHALKREQLRHSELIQITGKHLANCTDCLERSSPTEIL